MLIATLAVALIGQGWAADPPLPRPAPAGPPARTSWAADPLPVRWTSAPRATPPVVPAVPPEPEPVALRPPPAVPAAPARPDAPAEAPPLAPEPAPAEDPEPYAAAVPTAPPACVCGCAASGAPCPCPDADPLRYCDHPGCVVFDAPRPTPGPRVEIPPGPGGVTVPVRVEAAPAKAWYAIEGRGGWLGYGAKDAQGRVVVEQWSPPAQPVQYQAQPVQYQAPMYYQPAPQPSPFGGGFGFSGGGGCAGGSCGGGGGFSGGGFGRVGGLLRGGGFR